MGCTVTSCFFWQEPPTFTTHERKGLGNFHVVLFVGLATEICILQRCRCWHHLAPISYLDMLKFEVITGTFSDLDTVLEI